MPCFLPFLKQSQKIRLNQLQLLLVKLLRVTQKSRKMVCCLAPLCVDTLTTLIAVMKDEFSDDDDYEEDLSVLDQIAPPTKKGPIKPPVNDKDRVEREAKLSALWDEDDTEMKEDVTDSPAAVEEPGSDAQSSQSAQDEVEDVSSKKRRGRRRVMKKKTYTDEEGYLVTKEEAEWESFSEDEPQAKKAKPQPLPIAGKKKAPAKGQGNIMSFFGKK
jgi:DNA polymerase delta subunit 3